MQISGQLYELLKSLTKSEKRYFKLHAGFNRSNSHLLQIFEAVTKYNIEDDITLKTRLKDADFLRHLGVLKVHLYQLVLSVMRSFHKNSSNTAILRDMLTDIQFLYSKGQYVLCGKLLKKAEGLALSLNQDNNLIEILEIERKLMGKSPKSPLNLQSIKKSGDAEKQAIIRLQAKAALKLMENLSQLMVENYQRDSSIENQSNLFKYCKKVQLAAHNSSISGSKIIYYNSIYKMLITLQEWESAMPYGQLLIAIQIEQAVVVKEHPLDLIQLLSQQVEICLKAKQIENAHLTVDIFTQLPLKFNKTQRRSKAVMNLLNDTIAACKLQIKSANQPNNLL